MSDTAEQIVKQELELYEEKQLALDELTKQLESNPQFKAFLQARKEFEAFDKEVWKRIESAMIANDIAQIKTNTMTLSIARKNNFKIDIEKLPERYKKVVADTTKINGIYKLEGRVPQGVKVSHTQYLTKRIKDEE